MELYDWLLFFHVTGAFLIVGGAVVAAALNIAAQGRERPSEIALLLRLTRIPVIAISVGMVIVLALGLWLVFDQDYSFGDTWVWLSLVLWVVAARLGDRGGKRDKRTRELAEQLAASGDAPTTELQARLRDPVSLALSYGSGLVVLGLLALMIWKPGH